MTVIIPKVPTAVLRNLRLLEGYHPGTMKEHTRKKARVVKPKKKKRSKRGR